MKRTLLCLAATFAPLLAHAACEDNFAKWTQALQPGRAFDDQHAVCKVWPANQALTIAALPLPLPQAGNTDMEGADDLEVLVADTATGAVVAHQLQKSLIQFDAMRFSGLAIDTARYQIAPQQLAFGVRLTHEGSSRANPYEATELSLYAMQGQKLQTVLGRLTVKESGGEWDENCAGTMHDTTRTVSIGPADQSGYAALKITEKSSTTVSILTAGNCVDHPKAAKPSTVTLPYRDGGYAVPKTMLYSD